MKYKKIKKLVPFCEDCQQEIRGNGSLLNPYECDCGKWEYDKDKHDYILEKENENI